MVYGAAAAVVERGFVVLTRAAEKCQAFGLPGDSGRVSRRAGNGEERRQP
jgi:hypothetical protein